MESHFRRDDAWLADAVQELDAEPDEIALWHEAVQRLADWPTTVITAADQQRLLAALTPHVPVQSQVRQAVHATYAGRTDWMGLLATVRTQISVLRPGFWLVSALIMLLGVVMELSLPGAEAAFFLRALGPLLAYLGVSSAFRGIHHHTIEWELACPPSPLQLILARLVVVLGYDLALGAVMSLVGWQYAHASFLLVTLHWLMPLLLVAGCALVLSLHLPFATAAGCAYIAWMSIVFVVMNQWLPLPESQLAQLTGAGSEIMLGLMGLACSAIALHSIPRRLPVYLPTGNR